MSTFIGIVHKDGKSDYGVSFPDFPGCITAGRTLDEAMEMAREALQGHIEVMYEHGDALPTKPMSVEAAKKHAFAKGATMFLGIEADLPRKPVRVNVMIDQALLQRIDRVAPNRSAFLAQAARDALANRPRA